MTAGRVATPTTTIRAWNRRKEQLFIVNGHWEIFSWPLAVESGMLRSLQGS